MTNMLCYFSNSQVACEGSSEAAMKSCDGHGSLVAGIMAGAWNNGDKGGIAGAHWRGKRVHVELLLCVAAQL